MDRNLLEYLPQFMRTYREIRAIMDTEQITVEELWDNLARLEKEGFVQDQSEVGAARWEAILGLVPKDTDSLEIRNLRIIGRLNEELPYTWRTMLSQLQAVCGENEFTVHLTDTRYLLMVRIALTLKGIREEIVALLERIVPANLELDIELMYNTYGKVSRLSYGDLCVHTYEGIREEPVFV